MSPPRLIIIEANTAEGRARQVAAGGSVTSERTARLLREFEPEVAIDICRPADADAALPPGAALEGYDGAVITGSSLHVYDDEPAVRRQIELTRTLIESGTPIFGSCWGLQVLTVAAGGVVRASPKGRELAIARTIRLTGAGRGHPMFAGKGDVFDATCVHLDEIETIAPGTTVLAANAMSQVQAAELRFARTTAWAVQYHPEYSLAEIAAIVRRGKANFVAEGFFAAEDDAMRYAADLDALNADPQNKALAWRYGIDEAILDRRQRLAELANWMSRLMRPMRAQRGRG